VEGEEKGEGRRSGLEVAVDSLLASCSSSEGPDNKDGCDPEGDDHNSSSFNALRNVVLKSRIIKRLEYSGMGYPMSNRLQDLNMLSRILTCYQCCGTTERRNSKSEVLDASLGTELVEGLVKCLQLSIRSQASGIIDKEAWISTAKAIECFDKIMNCNMESNNIRQSSAEEGGGGEGGGGGGVSMLERLYNEDFGQQQPSSSSSSSSNSSSPSQSSSQGETPTQKEMRLTIEKCKAFVLSLTDLFLNDSQGRAHLISPKFSWTNLTSKEESIKETLKGGHRVKNVAHRWEALGGDLQIGDEQPSNSGGRTVGKGGATNSYLIKPGTSIALVKSDAVGGEEEIKKECPEGEGGGGDSKINDDGQKDDGNEELWKPIIRSSTNLKARMMNLKM
jgi:hypothetical protein